MFLYKLKLVREIIFDIFFIAYCAYFAVVLALLGGQALGLKDA